MEWRIEDQPVEYRAAEAFMETRAAEIAAGQADELVWLLEHPPLYTAGTSARPEDLLDPTRFPVHLTRRGGEYTYHGPGQRVAYAMLDLGRRRRDVRAFVWALEEWVIRSLSDFTVLGERRADRVGVWVRRGDLGDAKREDKIAAIGVRLRRWVSFHGASINVDPDLTHYEGITPCGIAEHGVTSLFDLGITATTFDVDLALRAHFSEVFDQPARWEAGRAG